MKVFGYWAKDPVRHSPWIDQVVCKHGLLVVESFVLCDVKRFGFARVLDVFCRVPEFQDLPMQIRLELILCGRPPT